MIDQLKAGRVRRTFQLSNNCIANIAAYRSNWQTVNNEKTLRIETDLWVRANANFFDMAVIEWCKLFAEKNGKHHWSKTIKNRDEWKNSFLQKMEISNEVYEVELEKIREYRNKYVAHLDDPKQMNYPLTEFMLKSASYLYDWLKSKEETKIYLGVIYDNAENYYYRMMNEYGQEVDLRINNIQL